MKGKLHSSNFSVSLGKAVAAITFAVHSVLSSAALTIEQAQMMAVSSDSEIAQFQDKSKAANHDAVAVGQLPDPILIAGIVWWFWLYKPSDISENSGELLVTEKIKVEQKAT